MPLNWEELGTQLLQRRSTFSFPCPLGGSCEQPSQRPRQAWDGARNGPCEVERPDDSVTLDMSLHFLTSAMGVVMAPRSQGSA